MTDDQSLTRLDQITHIVVLMMENRSFDHMLGYLKRAGMEDVDGLTGDEVNAGPDGTEHKVFEFGPGETAFHQPGQPLDKSLDPCHSPTCVAKQLAGGNAGFVKNFVEQKNPPTDKHGLVMGHYTAQHLPTYDHLARHYCVCDRWHASIPGDTWPNRLYALSGGEEARVKPDFLQELASKLGPLKALNNLPIYDVKAFTHHLDDDQWRWYSHDPATLRAADGAYRDPTDFKTSNFAYFDRKRVSLATQAAESLIEAHDSFLDDAAKGELRNVSWIDPNFIDLSVLDPNSNDDHPPSDVRAGQALVLEVYEALRKSPEWNDTLLVIVYDEHGGFYDHVPPPPVDNGNYKTLGVRVPAIVVGPRVRQFVCHEVFDHTTLIKTILTRFAATSDAAIQGMGPRVANAADLSIVLEDRPRQGIPDPAGARTATQTWRTDARAARQPAEGQGVSEASDGAGQEPWFPDFAQEVAAFALAMRQGPGLPPGQP